jgi:hypothetical protein
MSRPDRASEVSHMRRYRLVVRITNWGVLDEEILDGESVDAELNESISSKKGRVARSS